MRDWLQHSLHWMRYSLQHWLDIGSTFAAIFTEAFDEQERGLRLI